MSGSGPAAVGDAVASGSGLPVEEVVIILGVVAGPREIVTRETPDRLHGVP